MGVRNLAVQDKLSVEAQHSGVLLSGVPLSSERLLAGKLAIR